MVVLPQLLTSADPPPFRVFEGAPESPFVITADHAGSVLPRALGTLGLSAEELSTHIACDIGIAGVAERLAAHLQAFLILQTYSRLVIDCNRPLTAESSIAALSETTVIPGNRALTVEQAATRAREVFEPYHQRIERELSRREAQGQRTILLAMHSFTPRYKGVDRPWHCGVLYNRDTRLAHQLLTALRSTGLEVGDNEPYFVSDETDYGVPRYGEQRGNLHVEIELRQDLIAGEAQQAEWATLLDRAIRQACSVFLP